MGFKNKVGMAALGKNSSKIFWAKFNENDNWIRKTTRPLQKRMQNWKGMQIEMNEKLGSNINLDGWGLFYNMVVGCYWYYSVVSWFRISN